MKKNVVSPPVAPVSASAAAPAAAVSPVEVVPPFDVDPVVSLPLSQVNVLVESLRSIEERVTALERNPAPAVAVELKRMKNDIGYYTRADMARWEQIDALKRALADTKAQLRHEIYEVRQEVAKTP